MKFLYLWMLGLCFSCTEPPVSKTETSTTEAIEKKSNARALDVVLPSVKYVYDSLSFMYDYKVLINRDTTTFGREEPKVALKIYVRNKEEILIDSILTDSFFFERNDYTTEGEVRSYVTGFNVNRAIRDNFYGYLVIADFNFDNLEDFAVMREFQSNAGPLYEFYIQNEEKEFEVDTFLTNTVAYFPVKIDTQYNEIETSVRVWDGAVYYSVYEWRVKTKKWIENSTVLIDFTERRNGLSQDTLHHIPTFIKNKRSVFVGANITKGRRIVHGLEMQAIDERQLKYKIYERKDFKHNWQIEGKLELDPISVNEDQYYVYYSNGKKFPAYRLIEFRDDGTKLEVLIAKKKHMNSSFARVFEIKEQEGIEDPMNDLTYLLHAK